MALAMALARLRQVPTRMGFTRRRAVSAVSSPMFGNGTSNGRCEVMWKGGISRNTATIVSNQGLKLEKGRNTRRSDPQQRAVASVLCMPNFALLRLQGG